MMSIFALSTVMCKFVQVSSIIDCIYHIILLQYHSSFGSDSQNHSKKITPLDQFTLVYDQNF